MIERLAHGGAGVARHRGQVVFVPGGLPGDRVRVELVARRARHLEGRLAELLEPSPARVEPACPYAGRCGGCQWLALAPAAQEAARVELLRDALVRIGRLEPPAEIPVVSARPTPAAGPGTGPACDRPAPESLGYRRRIEVALGPLQPASGAAARGVEERPGRRPVGFRAAGSHAVVDVARCVVAAGPLNDALAALRRAVAAGRVPPPVAEIELAVGDDPARLVATARLDRPLPAAAAARLADRLWAAWPGLAGLRIEPPRGSRRAAAPAQERGEPWIRFAVPGPAGQPVPLEAPAGVFVQVNAAVSNRLVEAVTAALAPAPGRRLLDLFCGVGTFALPLAAAGAEVLGFDTDGRAIEAARRTAARLGLAGARFRQIDAAEGLAWYRAEGGGSAGAGQSRPRAAAGPGSRAASPDGVVLDPPRAGAGPVVVDRLADLAPGVIAYVSCEPTTLARDLARLVARGYRLERLTLFDMFPQTAHLEALACLVRQR